jgi:glc operon protein GlcG
LQNEGCIFVSATAAQGKSVAAVGFGRPSGEVSAESAVVQVILGTQGGRMIPAQGALPIVQNGQIVGAIGGSGGTAEQDEDCARVGLAALYSAELDLKRPGVHQNRLAGRLFFLNF